MANLICIFHYITTHKTEWTGCFPRMRFISCQPIHHKHKESRAPNQDHNIISMKNKNRNFSPSLYEEKRWQLNWGRKYIKNLYNIICVTCMYDENVIFPCQHIVAFVAIEVFFFSKYVFLAVFHFKLCQFSVRQSWENFCCWTKWCKMKNWCYNFSW